MRAGLGGTAAAEGVAGGQAAGPLDGSLMSATQAPALEQVLVGDLAHARAGTPITTRARRDVAGDHRAGGDERLLADLDAGDEHRAAADPAGAAQRRRRAARLAAWRPIVSSLVVSRPGPMKTSSSTTVPAVM